MSAEKRTTESREFEVIIYGATSFVGELVAEHFAANYKQSQVKWAIAGRSQSKLDQVKGKLVKIDADLHDLEILIADSQDRSALDKMTSKTIALITTVGPYAKYGDMVVESCVENGTGYLDLTGESHWAAKSIKKNHKRAEETGALIVHFCGFDSIPSDIGSFMMVNHIKNNLNAQTVQVKTFVSQLKGGISGGTFDSMFTMIESGSAKEGRPRHQLCPDPKKCHPGPVDKLYPVYDKDLNKWTCPFFMAPVNTRVVRRSAALLGEKEGYANDFEYDERMLTSNLFWAVVVTFCMVTFGLLASFSVTRGLLKKVLPAPGEGPSKESREAGRWRYKYVATAKTKTGELKKVTGFAGGKKDPGYGDTATLLSETAIFMAKNRDECAKGGVLTPASAFGAGLLARLNNFNIQFQVDN